MNENGTESTGPRIDSADRFTRRLEIVITAILALATLAAAWSGYQAARWSGVQASAYSQASARRVDATRAATRAGQLEIYDSALFTAWIAAKATNNTVLETFEANRFRPQFRVAFDAWLALDPFTDPSAAASPFELSSYDTSLAQQSNDLEAEASALFDQGVEANQQADDYVLNTVFLAAALFLAGIASRFRWRPVQITVVGLSAVLLAYSLVDVIRYPIA